MEALIYDRTKRDIEYAKSMKLKALRHEMTPEEKAEWNKGLRGALNARDFNRMESWVEYLNGILAGAGYGAAIQPVKRWAPGDVIYRTDVDRVRSNIVALRDGFLAIPEWREILFEPKISMDQLNAMEWDLNALFEWAQRALKIFYFSGDLFAGEV